MTSDRDFSDSVVDMKLIRRLAEKRAAALVDELDYIMPSYVFHSLCVVVDYLKNDGSLRFNHVDQQIETIRAWLDDIRQDSLHENEWQRQQQQKYNLLTAAKRGDAP